MAATQHQIDADRRPPIGLTMTYRVEGVPRTGRVCYYQRGTGHRDYQVCDDLSPYVWRTLVLDDARIIAPAEYRPSKWPGDNRMKKCRLCNGTGTDTVVRSDGSTFEQQCGMCGGSGSVGR